MRMAEICIQSVFERAEMFAKNACSAYCSICTGKYKCFPVLEEGKSLLCRLCTYYYDLAFGNNYCGNRAS